MGASAFRPSTADPISYRELVVSGFIDLIQTYKTVLENVSPTVASVASLENQCLILELSVSMLHNCHL